MTNNSDRNKILLALLAVLVVSSVATGLYVANKPDTQMSAHVVASEPSESFSEGSEQEPEVLKYGQAFEYLNGTKITVSKPHLPKEGIWITEEGQVTDFTVLFEAPEGWLSEEGNPDGPKFGFRTTDGDVTASIFSSTFFDAMAKGTKKTYKSQLISPKDSWKTGAITLNDTLGVVAIWE